MRGSKVVWTVHNLSVHESVRPKLEALCSSFLAKRADAFIVHGEVAAQAVLESIRPAARQRIDVMPHGHYIDWYPNDLDTKSARERLRIEDSTTVFLFLGQIRPYKGVGELVDGFRKLDAPAAELVIAGMPVNEELKHSLRRRIGDCTGIRFVPRFIEDHEVQTYMNASDVVVLPYRRVLTSGAALLAMSFGRACIAPRLGLLKEVLDDSGAFLYEPDDKNGLFRALDSAMRCRGNLGEMGTYNRKMVSRWRWDAIARATAEIYTSICSNDASNESTKIPRRGG
jgi:glycosyltransferase involved in cell wall biosynthesis